SRDPESVSQASTDFVSLAKKLAPVVVNIATTQVSGEATQESPGAFGGDDPSQEFWRRFFDNAPHGGPFRQKSLGSGFIIDSDGTILTNNHVVENAARIQVRLLDGREFAGKLVGRDSKTDIALIKIIADARLPVAPLGDSDKLQVGEWVMAIGNPFGLDHTVTTGIVSAKGRQIGAGPYDNFIQTDASINVGNSGGPLINLRGEVVGINSAILSQSGGNIGIGFAAPINLAKELLPQLKATGRVVRGWMGVSVQTITPALAESLGLRDPAGALVADVKQDGPAARAGMKVGDVILELDGQPIKSAGELPALVARIPVNTGVRIKVARDGTERFLTAIIAKMGDETDSQE
ncbi:MAG: Do family serine endopeptidase, partial [Candidatus Binatia bacterium]